MKKLIILLLLASLVLCLIGISMQNPKKTNEGLYRAHNRLERMVDRKEGSEEFRGAVLEERIYMSDAETTRGLGRTSLWLGVGANLAALIAVLAGWKKEPDQAPGRTPGRRPPLPPRPSAGAPRL